RAIPGVHTGGRPSDLRAPTPEPSEHATDALLLPRAHRGSPAHHHDRRAAAHDRRPVPRPRSTRLRRTRPRMRPRAVLPEVTIVCGMTETSPISTQTALDDPLEKRVATVGRVHPHLEVKVVDPDSGSVV